MLHKPAYSNISGPNKAELEKFNEIQYKQIQYLNNKSRLLKKIKKLLGTSKEMSELINNILEVISDGDEIIKLIPEYFENIGEKGIQSMRAIGENYSYLSKENETLKKDNDKKMEMYRLSGERTKETYGSTELVAHRIISQYAKKHPNKLSENTYTRGVKTELDKLILEEMSKPENFKKAHLSAPPSSKTITKYRKIVFETLNLP